MQIDVTDTHFLITDPSGRRSGFDYRNKSHSDDSEWLQEIPDANYGSMGVGSLDPNDTGISSMEFTSEFIPPKGEGIYTIQVIGIKLEVYSMSVSISKKNKGFIRFETDDTPIEKDSIVTYRLTYYDSPDSIKSLKKDVSIQSLFRDLSAMSKLGWLKITADTYFTLHQSLKTSYELRDYASARTTLTTLLSKLQQDSVMVISGDACRLLAADIRQLFLEPPFTLSPLAAVDTLRNLLPYAFANSWIGDVNLINELNNGLENARKHLGRNDKINCSKEVSVFQDKIKKEYEKKSTSKDKRFVTENGYKFLYFNAQYIIDRLQVQK
jgi:hypothetical protein